MKLVIKPLNQTDTKWANVKLGSSTVATIKSDGCLLTDASMICNYFGKETDPQKLNTDLIRVKGYFETCRLIYGAITDIYPDITVDWDNFIDCSDTPTPLDKIDAILFSKRPVIVKVDYDTKTAKIDEHWITIVGKTEDGAYICNDPIDGTEIFFQARYGDPSRYIFKIVAYNGTLTTVPSPEDRIVELESKVKSLNESVANLSLENNTLRTDLSTQERDNADLAKQLSEARGAKDKVAWEAEQLKIKIDLLTKEVESNKEALIISKKAYDALKLDYTKLSNKKLSEYGKWELLKALFRG